MLVRSLVRRRCSSGAPPCALKSTVREDEALVSKAVYDTGGALMGKLLKALQDQGLISLPLSPDKLAAVDQFHIGGLKATQHLLSKLHFAKGCRVLDIGCGLGGFSRHVSQVHPDCTIHGVDITEEYIDVCKRLTEMTGVQNTTYEVGSATSLPGPDLHYHIASMLHVGMNVRDKAEIFHQVHRVLRPDGVFAVYDVMKSPESDNVSSGMRYPVPWANDESHSFVESIDTYISAAENSNFEILSSEPRKDFALSFFAPLLDRLNKNGGKMPAYSLALLFGEEHAEVKMKNLINMISSDVIVPVELIFRKKFP